MVKRNLKWLPIILGVFLLIGCAGMQGLPGEQPKVKSIEEMTPKERATFFMGIYNAQARDYKAQVKRANLTNEQKEVLRQKKKIMSQVWPMINTYNAYVDSGAVPTKAVEDQIITLINDLTSLVLPHVAGEGG